MCRVLKNVAARCAVCAGSRIGWAVVQDKAVAELMRRHVSTASGYVQESQLRAAALLQYVLSTNGVAYSPLHPPFHVERTPTPFAFCLPQCIFQPLSSCVCNKPTLCEQCVCI